MKTLERRYSKIERIVAKARFSAWVFMTTVIIALVLGAVIAVVWVFNDTIEGWFTKEDTAQFLTDDVMRWVLLGAAVVVLICFIVQLIQYNSREMLITEDKIVYREGIASMKTVVIPLSEIRIVEMEQGVFQRIVGVGDMLVVSDAEKPYRIKNVASADRLTRKIMSQILQVRRESSKPTKIMLV